MAEQEQGDGATRRLDALGISRLEVHWKNGAITIVGTTNGDLIATAKPPEEAEWSFDVRGGTAILRQNDDNSLFFDTRPLDVTVQVPASVGETDARTGMGNITVRGLRGKLDLKSGSGDVLVERTDGPLDVKSGLGEIELREISGKVDAKSGRGNATVQRIDGSLSLVIGDGDVTVEGVRDATLDLTTGRGNVTVADGVVRSLRVKTGLGEVHCSASLGTGDHDLRTGFGDITVALVAEAGARVDAATGWGEVESDFPLVRVGRPGPAIFGGQRFVGTVGPGTPIAELKMRTGKGDIRLRKAQAAAPSPPESPPRPAPPPTPAEGPATTTPEAPSETKQDQRLAILDALRRGEITVDEADRRMRELG